MHIDSVDPRDQVFETITPHYRVYFFDPAPPGRGATSYEYEISGADDVNAVITWAESERGARTYVLYVRPGGDGGAVNLIRLLGYDPNEQQKASSNR